MSTTSAPALPSFALLREVARCEPVKTVIEARRDQIARTGWDIVPSEPAAEAMKGNHAAMREFGARRDEAARLFRQPDPDFMGFSRWLARIAEDMLVTDAAAIWLRKTQDGKRLACLSLLNGDTIEPHVDRCGRLTDYAQYLEDVPRRDFTEIAATQPSGCTLRDAYPPGSLMYVTFTQRRGTPFGFSPLERSLVYADDGAVDLTTTAGRLLEAADDRWVASCLDRLRTGPFQLVLDHFGDGLRWKWEQ